MAFWLIPASWPKLGYKDKTSPKKQITKQSDKQKLQNKNYKTKTKNTKQQQKRYKINKKLIKRRI